MAKERSIPAPMTSPETEPFWAAAREGRFTIKRCEDCGRAHWYPRSICPHCGSENTVWADSPGTGVIYSVSVMKRAPEVYAIAYVTLDEGTTMMTNIVECDYDRVAIGDRVQVTWRPTAGEDGPPYPVFKPA
jgi:uncharacterized OB-fold protein